MSEQITLTTELEAARRLNDLKTVMRIKDISSRSMVELMRTEFPRFDKTLLSKVCSPELYGIVLHPRGYEILGEFPDRKPENRKLKKRITIRMSEDEADKLLAYAAKDGYKSIQDWGRDKIREYIAIAEVVLGRL